METWETIATLEFCESLLLWKLVKKTHVETGETASMEILRDAAPVEVCESALI